MREREWRFGTDTCATETQLGLTRVSHTHSLSLSHSLSLCACACRPNTQKILYPFEDKDEKRLKFECKHCDYVENATTGLIYRHEVQHSLSEKSAIITDVTSDPTLPKTREVECPQCGNDECVYFQSTSRSDAEAMTLYFVCCRCGHRFKEGQT